MKSLIVLILLFFLFSCNDNKKAEFVSSVEKLEQKIDSIETQLVKNQIDTLVGLRTAANTLEIRIRQFYNADSINYDLDKKMNAFKVIRRSFDPETDGGGEVESEEMEKAMIGRSYTVIKTGITSEREALKRLKDDIQNNNGDREKYQEYIDFETNKVYQLERLLTEYVTQKKKVMKRFYELYNDLNAFSLKLMEQKQRK
jgi:predicted metal-dependent phosphoesterase TrpH